VYKNKLLVTELQIIDLSERSVMHNSGKYTTYALQSNLVNSDIKILESVIKQAIEI
jgi:hypothetical protein